MKDLFWTNVIKVSDRDCLHLSSTNDMLSIKKEVVSRNDCLRNELNYFELPPSNG